MKLGLLQSWPGHACSPAEGAVLEKGCDIPVHPRRAASQGLILRPTRPVILIVHEVVDYCKVPGQPKHGPLDNHSLIPNLDPFGDNIKGAKGGNSDPLQMEDNGRAKG